MRGTGTLFGRRVIRAFLIAPLVPAAAVIAFVLGMDAVAMFDGVPLPGFDDLWQLYEFGIVLSVFSYPTAFVLGIPSYVGLKRMGRVGIVYAILAGLLIGTVISPVLAMSLLTGNLLSDAMTMWPFSATGAVLASIAFWFIARPDRAAGGA